MTAPPDFAWPAGKDIVLAITAGEDYSAAVRSIMQTLSQEFEGGVVLTANRPARMMRRNLEDLNLESTRFVDCIAGITGLLPPPEDGVVFVESPVLLEKAAMKADQQLRAVGEPKFLLVDSVSTLAVYNNASTVAEFVHNLTTRMRMRRVRTIFLLVETQADTELIEAVSAHCDSVQRIAGHDLR